MRALPTAAEHQFAVFTFDQAISAGWTESALRHAVAAGRLLRLRAGVFCGPPHDDLHHRERDAVLLGRRGVAIALSVPDAAVSHAAALAVRGLPLYRAGALPCVTKPQRRRTLQHDLHLHRKKLSPQLLDPKAEFAVTSVARSCIDVACELGLAAGVIAADAALRAKLVTGDELQFARRSIRGDVGSPTAGRLLEVVDGRAESPLESLSRVNMLGLVPRPMIQPMVFTADGEFIGRCDFVWEELGVIGEADGSGKYENGERDELGYEKWRQDRLTDTDAVMARWGWGMAQSPTRLANYLESRFAVARARRAAGIRPRWIIRPT